MPVFMCCSDVAGQTVSWQQEPVQTFEAEDLFKLQTIMILYYRCCLSLEGGKTRQGVYVCVGVGPGWGWGGGGRSTQIISNNCWSVHRSCLSVLNRGTVWPVSYLKDPVQGGGRQQQQPFSPESTPVFKQ